MWCTKYYISFFLSRVDDRRTFQLTLTKQGLMLRYIESQSFSVNVEFATVCKIARYSLCMQCIYTVWVCKMIQCLILRRTLYTILPVLGKWFLAMIDQSTLAGQYSGCHLHLPGPFPSAQCGLHRHCSKVNLCIPSQRKINSFRVPFCWDLDQISFQL